MTLTVADLRAAIDRLVDAMARDFDMLNSADGALGDGDLGVTLTRGTKAMQEAAPGLPDDLGQALLACAQAFTRTSGSSYGTLMATGLMSMAKALKGRTGVEASEVSALIAGARDAMQARGKAELGGKTVLDSLDAMAQATAGLTDPAAVAAAAADAAARAQAALKDKPATVGRARIFGEKTIGMDDPGMIAMTAIAAALAGR
ncbi:dihydroxyacetone kinase subunit L [Tabrizicola sp. YIM 78059]|uniref:dihydroxyacetone kinase subunit L n=1 Tax=Tabrizicola sp. YIM 78059 TaxID=2529861 RepID=UPI0010AB4270|nr:dihydroxyacetone kinase subunit L [Tabrizicola sp. YIM 78059]